MRTPPKAPVVTLTLALLITIIQVFRLSGGGYNEFVMANLHHGSWETFYNQPWRVLTSPFLHQNILHYFENFIFLLLFGWKIERSRGSVLLLGAFFGAMVTSYVTFIMFMHDMGIGISGGICGLFGFSLIADRRTPWWTTLTHRPLHLLYFANLILAVIVDIANIVPYPVAHLVHLVGILYGMAFGAVVLLAPHGILWRGAVFALPLMLFASLFYSPWEVDWRLAKRQPTLVTANADCRLKSARQDTYIATTAWFVNASRKPVAIYWLDYEGHAQYYNWLWPGDSQSEQTYIGHPWCVVDVDSGEALQGIMLSKPGQTITIH